MDRTTVKLSKLVVICTVNMIRETKSSKRASIFNRSSKHLTHMKRKRREAHSIEGS